MATAGTVLGKPIVTKLLIALADPKNVGKLCELVGSMPNVDMKTLGGKVFWETLGEEQGWKLQKNKFTDHYRVLDPNDVRKAWGSEKIMAEALKVLHSAD